jgi:hypothetical protein
MIDVEKHKRGREDFTNDSGMLCIVEPTTAQLRSLYRLCHLLTNVMFQPIYIVRLDERTLNWEHPTFYLAGKD